jgi:hypothetical protein
MVEIKSYSQKLFFIFITASLLANPLPEDNDTSKFEPVFEPTLSLTKTHSPIIVDGSMNDEGWIGAAETSSFTEYYPDELVEPPIKIRVLATYDNEYFYLAFFVNDDPRKIRASLTDRDEIWSDDYVGFLLDTYGDASWAYFIFSNPLGIQGDTRWVSGIGEDAGIDLLFESAGKITEKGYQVEMAIPFSSLRFPDKEQQIWKATFWITHPREFRSTYTWAATTADNSCWLCQWGTIEGINGIKPKNQIELLPSVVGSQVSTQKSDGDLNAGLNAGDFAHDEGMGIKYRITPNLVLDATYNPDFSQVEADAAQIDVNNPFALFYSERRPFFLEGGDLFRTYKKIVYSRTINDPLAAAKLTGRFGSLNLAYIGAVDEHTPLILPFEERSATLNTSLRSTSNIFRVKQTFGNTGYLGLLVTDRRIDDGGVGSLVSVDGVYRFLERYLFEWQIMGSRTVELNDSSVTANYGLENLTFGKDTLTATFDGEQFDGSSAYLSLQRYSKNWSFDFDYYSTSPTFRANNGFIDRNNRRVFTMNQEYNFYPKAEWVDRINPMIYIGRVYNYDNIVKDEWITGQIIFRLKGQTTLALSGNYGNEIFGYQGQRFKGYNTLEVYGNTAFSEILRFGTEYTTGKSIYRNPSNPLLAYITDLELWATFKPVQWLSFQPTINYYEMHYPEDPAEFPADYQGNAIDMAGKEIYSGYIARIEMNYQFTRELFLRTIFEYDDFNKTIDVDLLFTYRINPFSAIYVGSSIDYLKIEDNSGFNKSSRNYFFKLQYLFRI